MKRLQRWKGADTAFQILARRASAVTWSALRRPPGSRCWRAMFPKACAGADRVGEPFSRTIDEGAAPCSARNNPSSASAAIARRTVWRLTRTAGPNDFPAESCR